MLRLWSINQAEQTANGFKLMEEKRGKYVPATVELTSFSCPHCGTFASQSWFVASGWAIKTEAGTPTLHRTPNPLAELQLVAAQANNDVGALNEAKRKTQREQMLIDGRVVMGAPLPVGGTIKPRPINNLHYSLCYSCGDVSVWHQDRLLYPELITAPEPNEDMPPDVERDYREAAAILSKSPRGAAALLRLAIEKVCRSLGYENDSINEAIADMVSKGLSSKIQKALDTVRVVGNESVHPGELDMNDNGAVATKLFSLVNVIVQDRITAPRQIDELYEGLVPEKKRDAISKRDKSKRHTSTD